MASVTQRIKQIKQPRGGYIGPKQFSVRSLGNANDLHTTENIRSNLVGLAVDYLTRFSNGTSVRKAFEVSLKGAALIGHSNYAEKLLSKVVGLDDDSIVCACKLVGFDVCYRAGIMGYRPVEEIIPDVYTISNIQTMVKKSMVFFEQYGPIVKDGFTFEGGYTELVSAGDGDFLTHDTIWDFKVSNKAPTNIHTLQLLMYYLMGIHSIHKEFQSIEKLGVFNPRLNNVYLFEISKIPTETIEEVSKNVIGY